MSSELKNSHIVLTLVSSPVTTVTTEWLKAEVQLFSSWQTDKILKTNNEWTATRQCIIP